MGETLGGDGLIQVNPARQCGGGHATQTTPVLTHRVRPTISLESVAATDQTDSSTPWEHIIHEYRIQPA